jgi:SAM-dependent methyltransferase
VSGPDALPERFASDWLSLREPADHRARSEVVARRLVDWFGATAPAPLRVVDLGAGTGSNLRWLAPRLPQPQAWTLLDHDPALLERVVPPSGVEATVTRLVAPLGGDAGALSAEAAEAISSADLVTASALLDLVSADLLHALVDAVAAAGAATLLALSYDGTITWTDPDPDDALVRDAVNAHQRRDKGTGPALGPTAADAARTALERAGFTLHAESSPWTLGPEDAALARALLDGWVDAAVEERPSDATAIRAWATRRREAIADGSFGLEVGHVDISALPGTARSRAPRS